MYFNGASSIKPPQPPYLLNARVGVDITFIALNEGIMRYSFNLAEPQINNKIKYETLVV